MSVQPEHPQWSTDTKRLALVFILVVAAVLAYFARSLLVVLVLAGLFSYLLQPVISRLEGLGLGRGLATFLCLLTVVLLLVLVPVLVVPVVARQAVVLFAGLYDAAVLAVGVLLKFISDHPVVRIYNVNVDLAGATAQFQTSLKDSLQGFKLPSLIDAITYVQQGVSLSFRVLGTAVSFAAGVVWGVAVAVITVLFVFLYTFYLTRDAPRLRAWVDRILPPQYVGEIDQLLDRTNHVWQSFFRGQIVLSLVMGTLVTVVMTAVGMPAALVLGIIAGLLEVVPSLGPALAAVPAVILALVEGSSWLPVSNPVFALIVLGCYIVMQQLENAMLVPRVMGQSLNLHPIFILIGIVIGASAFGIVGAFLAAPVLATLALVGTYAHAKLLDRPPFPDPFPLEKGTSAVSPARWRQWWRRWQQNRQA